jgi:hypothetical protein
MMPKGERDQNPGQGAPKDPLDWSTLHLSAFAKGRIADDR